MRPFSPKRYPQQVLESAEAHTFKQAPYALEVWPWIIQEKSVES